MKEIKKQNDKPKFPFKEMLIPTFGILLMLAALIIIVTNPSNIQQKITNLLQYGNINGEQTVVKPKLATFEPQTLTKKTVTQTITNNQLNTTDDQNANILKRQTQKYLDSIQNITDYQVTIVKVDTTHLLITLTRK